MSQWTDRIRNHQVWQQLQSLGPAIDQAVAREGVDPDTVAALERLRAVLTFVGKRLAAADPATTHPGPLDGITTALQNSTNEVQAFVANGNAGHVANANSHGDTALSHLAQVAVPTETRSREYTDAQGARQEKFGALIADFTARLAEQNADFSQQKDAAIKSHSQDMEELRKECGEAAKAVLDQIDGHRQDVEKLVGVIGDLGVTSGYVKTANYARKALWIWQSVAVLAMGGVIFAAYKLFIPQLQGAFSWEAFAGRLILSLTVGVLAAYAANQADKYLDMERRNRQLALELAAIGPFLAPLPQEKQDEFRLNLGAKTFGQNGVALAKGTDKSPATVLDLAKSSDLRDIITEAVKAARGV